MDPIQLRDIALRVFQEDESHNDVTTKALFRDRDLNAREWVRFSILAKEEGVFAGRAWIETLAEVTPFQESTWDFDKKSLLQDGDRFFAGTHVLRAHARAAELLSVERGMLNMLQHLCGVATQCRRYCDAIEAAAKAKSLKKIPKLLHTRKTLPLLRDLQLDAVRAGGAQLHRRDLSSRIMLKDNHELFLGRAGKKLSDWLASSLSFEERASAIVEVETYDEALAVADVGIGHLLLDNFRVPELERTLSALPETVSVEVSGGITLESLPERVLEGVDFISIGALTHSVRSVDLSLEVEL
jgi:nicotinate-nucleotide pyrophosphorylase (carboxylating)